MQDAKNPLPQLVLSYGEDYFNALFAAHFPEIPDEEAVILKQKLKGFCQFYPHQVNYQTFTELFTQFELDLIDKGNSEQASAMLRQTLSAAQKAALKKVIRGFEPCDQYVCDENGNEIGVPSVNLDPLIEVLTGDEV